MKHRTIRPRKEKGTFTVSEELLKRARRISDEIGITMSFLVERGMKQQCAKYEALTGLNAPLEEEMVAGAR